MGFFSGGTLKPGDAAPDFELPDREGRPVRLRDLLERGPLVLYFYPGDYTPVCSAEACAFRDDYKRFVEVGAQVAGVSADPPASHAEFSRDLNLPFPLLSDADGAVRARYGIKATLGAIPGRATFLIGSDGTIRHVTVSQFRPGKHVRETLDALGKLSDEER